MTEFHIWGGYSWRPFTEEYESIEEAAATYFRRMCGYDDGIRFPCWGDVPDDEYAITDGIDEGWTIQDLRDLITKKAEEQ